MRMIGSKPVWSGRALALLAVAVVVLQLLPATPVSASSAARGAAALPGPGPCDGSAGACWKPAVKARWNYQLQGSPNPHGGGCLHKSTGFVNIGVTGTSF